MWLAWPRLAAAMSAKGGNAVRGERGWRVAGVRQMICFYEPSVSARYPCWLWDRGRNPAAPCSSLETGPVGCEGTWGRPGCAGVKQGPGDLGLNLPRLALPPGTSSAKGFSLRLQRTGWTLACSHQLCNGPGLAVSMLAGRHRP